MSITYTSVGVGQGVNNKANQISKDIDTAVLKENFLKEDSSKQENNLVVYNSRINMLILENILEYYGKRYKEKFEPLSQWSRDNQFDKGTYKEKQSIKLSKFFKIDIDYFTGKKRFYSSSIEKYLLKKSLYLKKLDRNFIEKGTIPFTIISNHVKQICVAFENGVVLEDQALENILYCVKYGSLVDYCPFDKVAKVLNSFSFDDFDYNNDNLENTHTHELQLKFYLEVLEAHHQKVSSVYNFMRQKNVLSRNCHSTFREFLEHNSEIGDEDVTTYLMFEDLNKKLDSGEISLNHD